MGVQNGNNSGNLENKRELKTFLIKRCPSLGLYPRGVRVLDILDFPVLKGVIPALGNLSAGSENSIKPPHRAAGRRLFHSETPFSPL